MLLLIKTMYIYEKGTVEELPDIVATIYIVYNNNNTIDMNDISDKDV